MKKEGLKLISGLFLIIGVIFYSTLLYAGPLIELQVDVYNVNTDKPDLGGVITWSNITPGVTQWKAADRYLLVKYAAIQEQGDPDNSLDDVWYDNWGLQIYTENMGNTANPKYTGVYPQEYSKWGKAGAPAGDFAAGLICKDNTASRLPMCWRVTCDVPFKDDPATITKDEKLENLKIIEDPDDYGLRRKPKAEEDYKCWIWFKDKANDGWSDPIKWNNKYYQNPSLKWGDGMLYANIVNSNGIQHAEMSFDGWGVGPVVDMSQEDKKKGMYGVYVYLGARFTGTLTQTQYKTNTLTVELFNL